MVEVNCPKCGGAVEVDERRRADKGKFRLTCSECGKRFVIQVARPDLQSKSDATVVSTAPGLDDADSFVEPPPNIAKASAGGHGRSRWTRRGEAEARTTVYPAGDSPAGSSSPDSDTDYSESDSDRFDELADGEVALPGDPDDEATPMDFDELAEGEVALPGDPDEDGSLDSDDEDAPAVPDGKDDEEEESVIVQISAGDEPSADRGGNEPKRVVGGMSMEASAPSSLARAPNPASVEATRQQTPEPAAKKDPPAQTSVAESRQGKPKRPAGAARSSASPRKLVVAGQDSSPVLVSNLDSIAGHDLEPLGMVTHHFCRRGGGDRVLARKRVRAFGARYRKGLDELGRQAQALGADTVIGVEAIMQTTGPADDPIVWVLMQGTAAKRRPR